MNPVPRISPLSTVRAPLSAALALATLVLPAAAHPPLPGCGTGAGGPAPTINVQGEGRASVAPDLATVSLGVTTQAPTAAQAMADNAGRQTAILEALRAQGIAPADLQTQGLSLSPMQDFSREGQPPVITGYQAMNIVTARVRDLARLGPMLDAMVAAGATDVQGIGFSREDAAATEDRARSQAVAEARRRAEVIAQAAGMQLGPLVSLTDTSMSAGPRPLAMMARAADAAEASTPVEAGELTLSAQVTGVWSLVPTGGADRCGLKGGPHGGFHGGPAHHHDHGMMPSHGHGMRGHHSGMMAHPHHGEGMGGHPRVTPPGHMDSGMMGGGMAPPGPPGADGTASPPALGANPVPPPGSTPLNPPAAQTAPVPSAPGSAASPAAPAAAGPSASAGTDGQAEPAGAGAAAPVAGGGQTQTPASGTPAPAD